jgi:hypothetical protein
MHACLSGITLQTMEGTFLQYWVCFTFFQQMPHRFAFNYKSPKSNKNGSCLKKKKIVFEVEVRADKLCFSFSFFFSDKLLFGFESYVL